MHWQGWVFMALAWGFVGSLFFYCFWRILRGEPSPSQGNASGSLRPPEEPNP